MKTSAYTVQAIMNMVVELTRDVIVLGRDIVVKYLGMKL